MENTYENKAKFFALYYGQKVKSSCLTEQKEPTTIGHQTFHIFHLVINGILLLKPLSNISEEDAIEVANILLDGFKNVPKDFNLELHGRLFANDNDKTAYKDSAIWVNDFLRSKGYALPYMGHSVDDLVSFCWIKLK